MADVKFTDQNFDQEVTKSQIPVVVDFWAPWCGPCKIVSPIIEELAVSFAGKVKVGKLNVDENPVTAGTYGVMSIPTIIIFKNSHPVKSVVGAQGRSSYEKAVNEVLAA